MADAYGLTTAPICCTGAAPPRGEPGGRGRAQPLAGPRRLCVRPLIRDPGSDDDVPHAGIEVEMLEWAHPALTDEQWIRHVWTMSELYPDAGHDLLLVAQTTETDEDRVRLRTQSVPRSPSWSVWKPRRPRSSSAYRARGGELVGAARTRRACAETGADDDRPERRRPRPQHRRRAPRSCCRAHPRGPAQAAHGSFAAAAVDRPRIEHGCRPCRRPGLGDGRGRPS